MKKANNLKLCQFSDEVFSYHVLQDDKDWHNFENRLFQEINRCLEKRKQLYEIEHFYIDFQPLILNKKIE